MCWPSRRARRMPARTRLDDQVAFEFGDGADDHDDERGPAGRRCRYFPGS